MDIPLHQHSSIETALLVSNSYHASVLGLDRLNDTKARL